MSVLDWLVIAAYLAGTIGLGLWLSRKQENLEDYFLGGRAIPWWAALFSLVATTITAARSTLAHRLGARRLRWGVGREHGDMCGVLHRL